MPSRPTLPVYQVDPSVQERSEPELVVRELFGRRDATVTSRGPQVDVRGPEIHLDFDSGRGGVWAGDPSRQFEARQLDLPGRRALRSLGLDALKRSRVLPELTGPFRLGRADLTLNRGCRRHGDGPREDFTTTATYARDVVVDVSDRDDVAGSTLPLLGGGGRFRATMGEGGEVVGVLGAWREPHLVDERPLRAAEDVEAEVRDRGRGVTEVLGSTLGYWSAPAFTGQELMFPVYAVRRQARLGDRVIPMRTTFVPATDVGSLGWPQPQVTPRAEKPVLPRLPFGDSVFTRSGIKIPPGLAVDRNAAALAGLDWQQVIDLDLWPLDPEWIHALREARRPRSGGASWIGEFDWSDLSGSAGNAQGFVDGLTDLGWQVPFNWANGDAWITDWRENDDDYVDNVDVVFYTGHADMDGWVLSDGAGSLVDFDFTEVGASPSSMSDLWGRNNLEWVVIAACGPHQDEVISRGGGDVLARWDGAFDGLHLMLGYGAVSNDNTEEGKRLIRYCRQGMTIRDAWFRTAQEIQPSTNDFDPPNGPTVWASAMSISDAQGGTSGDHLWGHGSTYRDVRNWTGIDCLWVSC